MSAKIESNTYCTTFFHSTKDKKALLSKYSYMSNLKVSLGKQLDYYFDTIRIDLIFWKGLVIEIVVVLLYDHF